MTKWQRDKQRVLWLLDMAEDVGRLLRQKQIAHHLGMTQQKVSLLLRELMFKDKIITRTREHGYRTNGNDWRTKNEPEMQE